jgi:uncharacterized protein (TIGR00297 family)
MLINLLIGLVIAIIIAALAYQRGALSLSGAFGALITGALIFSIGGLAWAVLLVAFFVTSSALSHYRANLKAPLAEKFQKGHRRDLGQVLANGGAGALIALAYAFSPQPLLFVAYAGAIATVNADTWATELGVLSQTPPRLITNGRIVAVGTSGGITRLGTFVAFCGALVIGILASSMPAFLNAFFHLTDFSARQFLMITSIATIAGLFGALFDSFLGATVQAIYFCEVDQKETESAIHRCGNRTRLIRGWRWLDNDWVNFLASVVGSLSAAGLYLALGGASL